MPFDSMKWIRDLWIVRDVACYNSESKALEGLVKNFELPLYSVAVHCTVVL